MACGCPWRYNCSQDHYLYVAAKFSRNLMTTQRRTHYFRPGGLIELSSNIGALITVNTVKILKNWQHPLQQLDLPFLVCETSLGQRQIVQGRRHFTVILFVMLFLHLLGLAVVFETVVRFAQVPQCDCHLKMILSVMLFLHLEGTLVDLFGLAVAFEMIVSVAQVIQSETNAEIVNTEFHQEDPQVPTLFYLQCPSEKLLLRSEVPELRVSVCQVVRPRNFGMLLSVVLVFDHQCLQEHLLLRVAVFHAAFQAAQVHPSSPLAATPSATRTASAGICAFSLFSFCLVNFLKASKASGGRVGDERSEGSQLAVIARCRDRLVSLPKAIEEARHWSELPLLHGAAATIGPSPPSAVK